MKDKVDNRLGFTIYVWVSFCLFILVILYLMIFYFGFKNNNKLMINEFKSYVLIWPFLAVLSRFFDYYIKPAYFEAKISTGQIIIKTYNPNKANGGRFISMLWYDKYLTELVIDRQSYNNYKLLIDRLGFRKNLILQKIDNGKLYESTPINISFLGAKKYTDLILSIDRLKEKMTMN